MRCFLLSCFLFGCGPGEPRPQFAPDLKLTNSYAESLFALTYTLDGYPPVEAFKGERLAANTSKTFPDVINAADGSNLTATLVGTSLGKDYSFELRGVKPTQDIAITYDYDLATAKFRIVTTWGR